MEVKTTPRYIDADAILKDMCKLCTNFVMDASICEEKECAYTLLVKSAPTVDVQEVKHGHWIEINSDMGIYRCSQCRETVGGQTGSNFCPNCGAKMDEEEKK